MKYIYAISLALSLTLMAGCREKDKKNPEPEPEIEVAQVLTDSVVLHKTYPGIIKASTSADVVGEVNGRLLTRNYKEGEYVSKGQVLFTIESEQYRDALARAEATLQSAQSQYDYYTRQCAAMKKALQADAVSQMDVVQAESNVSQAAASISNAKAVVSKARLDLSHCTVRAPISGYITEPKMSIGNYVNGAASPQVLATIFDNSDFRANFEIEDSQYESMVASKGGFGSVVYRSIPLTFPKSLPHEYTADLFYESPSVSSTTGTIRLSGKVRNVDNELKDGMYVTVSLPYGVSPKAMIVKDAALGTDQLGRYLYLVNDSDKVVYTPVTVGELYHDSLRIVEKGVKPGDRYVVKALLTVRNGMKIKPINEK